MPLSTISESKTQRLEILGPDGKADPSIPVDISESELLDIYRKMVEMRLFDERAIKLQRQGRLGTYPQILGQEASQIVPPLCLKPSDWMVPTYRGQGAYYARGMQLRYSLLYWAGDDRGVHFPEGNKDMIFSIPVGTHLTQAAGLAWAAKLKKEDSIALAYVGDGSTSKGDFHEALTFAGQFRLPVIYLIENNHWAISVPRKKQSASTTLAEKASGYGIFGLQVDGNDALAVYQAVGSAVARARLGLGPSVLECETYRLGHHTTADDATRYRSAQEVEAWKKKDPITRLRKYLESRKLWNAQEESKLKTESEAMIQAEIDAYESFGAPNPLNMFSDNYASAPWHLIEQRAQLEKLLKARKSQHEALELPPVEGRFP
ncbi:MAG: pyruvate dehydrogenase (acetyl-transferring) E1 component subunit alpha [Elusimicrobia bacterium RIFCSPHIGHO2_02_FULL_57_9]|nr:MAG: pyruvate dehydrogenase (acetyl-transferring) E1 component subunit alpha [Elusimicrobia bacterium RIFCSPHIGHO2_02_FULL_57_9]